MKLCFLTLQLIHQLAVCMTGTHQWMRMISRLCVHFVTCAVSMVASAPIRALPTDVCAKLDVALKSQDVKTVVSARTVLMNYG